MKKYLTLILSICLLTFASCKKDKPTADDPTDQPTSTAAEISLTANTITYRAFNTSEICYYLDFNTNEGYQVSLVYYSDEETGNFTAEDLDTISCILDSNGNCYPILSGSFTVAIAEDEAYDFNANLGSNFEGKEYLFKIKLHREGKTPAKGTVENNISNATFSNAFDSELYTDVATFEGTTTDGVHIVFNYNCWAAFNGELENANVASYGSYIEVAGTKYELTEFVSATVTINNDKTFTLVAEVLFADGYNHKITMIAPIPTSTSEIALTLSGAEFYVDDYTGELVITAFNDDLYFSIYQVNGQLVTGTSKGEDIYAYIDHLDNYSSYLSYFVELTLNADNADNPTAVANIYASDGVHYTLTLSK